MSDCSTLADLVTDHIKSLPKCKHCDKMAVSRTLDAAGDGYNTCEDHQMPGWIDNRGPYPFSYVDSVNKINEFLNKLSF